MLKDILKDHFRIGTALNQTHFQNANALDILKKNFNSVTSENDMKWEKIQKNEGEFDFALSDRFVEMGKEYDMFIVGHTLIWHHQTPDWVFRDNSGNLTNRKTLLKRMRDHIFTVVGRYRGMVHGWDVVNEAISSDGHMRKNRWLEIIGEDYVENAFEYAHEADPEAELYYNDYSLVDPAKMEGVIRLVRRLLSKGIRVDGIGMQGHWSLDYPSKLDSIGSSILGFSELGIQVMITELDVDVLPYPGTDRGADASLKYELQNESNPYPDGLPDSVQNRLASRYADFFTIFKKLRDKISRVTIWGIHDGQTWLNNWPMHGRTNYPLLFDREYKPKPAYNAIIQCIKD
jgi:endo-1,4-beta-xylanase